MSADLARRAHILNELNRRKLELEAQARMVTLTTTTREVRRIKRQHAVVVARLARLKGRAR